MIYFFETPELDRDAREDAEYEAREELNEFITELKERVEEFRLDPEEAAADMLRAREWKVFSKYTWGAREARLSKLFTKKGTGKWEDEPKPNLTQS